MEPQGSLPSSQEPATRLSPESLEFSPYSKAMYFNIRFKVILECTPRYSK